MAARLRAQKQRGSAIFALPLLLALSAGLSAAEFGIAAPPPESPHLDGGARWLNTTQPGAIDDIPHQLGLPQTGSQWLLWGGGATLTRPNLRLQASAWTGGLQASDKGGSSAWDLQLAELSLEQGYPHGSLLVTGGAMLDHAELYGALDGPGGSSRVRAPLWGGGFSAGLRWPRRTPNAFFVRGAYM